MRTLPAALAALAVAGACATAPPLPPRPTPTPTAAPTETRELPAPSPKPSPVATPTPAPAPTAPSPAAMPSSDVAPPLVRVLLERTAEPARLPQPGRAYRATSGGRSAWVWGPVQASLAAGRTAWQIGAFSDPTSAAAAAERLRSALPGAVAEREPTTTGLVRVRVSWPEGSEPSEPRRALADAGFAGAFPVAAEGGAIRLVHAGGVLEGVAEVLLEPAGDWPVAFDGRRYRGRLRLRAAGAELLVVNELNLESYLQGVLPIEMGPLQFPELEALKAQAVAARTYAVAHLGDHDDEGWDLCDTPACQAYHGEGPEHVLTTRAVAETAGLVATFDGRPIDAMFSSTCGGHTEDAASLFTGREAPYLVGVPCRWERPLSLTGSRPESDWRPWPELELEVAAAALGLSSTAAPSAEVVRRVAAACGGAATPTAPGVEGFAGALLGAAGLGGAGEHLTEAASAVERLLAVADLLEAALGPPPAVAWDGGWHLRAALAVLRVQGVVSMERGELVPRPEGVGFFRRGAYSSEALPSSSPLAERRGDGVRWSVSATALPGTAAERWRRGEQDLVLVVVRSGGDGEADRRSAWRSWARERTWADLADRLGVPDLERLEVTARGRSGRVVGLAAHGRSGLTRTWSGFDVRRVLDLPDTLFTFHVLERPGEGRVARFLGRGWGHGVGLCQNGAYGLARAGLRFDRILHHYYTGIELERWPVGP